MNCCWEDLFGASVANFLPPRVSDHSLIGVHLEKLKKMPHSFKFFNMWCDDPQFMNIVAEVWSRNAKGTPMFQLYSKLKSLKKELKKLKREKFFEISNRVQEARVALEGVQAELQRRPTNEVFKIEKLATKKYLQLCRDEESFFKQKLCNQWLNL